MSRLPQLCVNQLEEPTCRNNIANETTKNWGNSLVFKSLVPLLCVLFNAFQVNDRSHLVSGRGMNWHSDVDRAVRLIISSSDGNATLHWRDGNEHNYTQEANIKYESGTTFCLVHNVNSKLFDHSIEHCPESDAERNVWVISLIPKDDSPLNITSDSIAEALEMVNAHASSI